MSNVFFLNNTNIKVIDIEVSEKDMGCCNLWLKTNFVTPKNNEKVNI